MKIRAANMAALKHFYCQIPPPLTERTPQTMRELELLTIRPEDVLSETEEAYLAAEDA